jgi:hypothetical protein
LAASALSVGDRFAVVDAATITLTDIPGSGDRRVASADVQINPPTLVSDNPDWVSILSWQGGFASQRGLVVDRLKKVGAGHYQSTEPIPVWGSWKTLLRVHDGHTLTAVPIYLPADPGINQPEVTATPSIDRPFTDEITVLQRERNPDAPGFLWVGGCLIVLVCTLIVVAGLTWGGARINRSEAHGVVTEPAPEPRGVDVTP